VPSCRARPVRSRWKNEGERVCVGHKYYAADPSILGAEVQSLTEHFPSLQMSVRRRAISKNLVFDVGLGGEGVDKSCEAIAGAILIGATMRGAPFSADNSFTAAFCPGLKTPSNCSALPSRRLLEKEATCTETRLRFLQGCSRQVRPTGGSVVMAEFGFYCSVSSRFPCTACLNMCAMAWMLPDAIGRPPQK